MIDFLKSITGRYFWAVYVIGLVLVVIWAIHTINHGHEAILRDMPR